ncbi:MAG: hypothetical protein WCX32_03560 [Clostridia bacterium]|jgi:hypothetical protein|nr:hypothetical protein [Clostridia bacterium]
MLNKDELIQIFTEHTQNNSDIHMPELFVCVATEFVQEITKEFYNPELYESEEEFAKNIIDKIKKNVKHFNSLNTDSTAEYINATKTLNFNNYSIKNTVLEIAKRHLNAENYKIVSNEIENNYKRVLFVRDSYRNITNNDSALYLNLYKFNLYYDLKHELLHSIKVQKKEIGLKKEKLFGNGIEICKGKKYSLAKAFNMFDEVVNELHNINLLPSKNEYFGQVKIENNSKNIYYVNTSFLSLVKCSRNLLQSYENFVALQGHKLDCNMKYHKAMNIAELFEILIGKNTLYKNTIENAFELYDDFNSKYRDSFKKYFDDIIKKSYFLNSKFNVSNNIDTFRLYDEKCSELFILEAKRLEPFDLLACLVYDLVDKDKNNFINYFDEQNIAQSVLLNCITEKVKTIKLNNSEKCLIKENKNLKKILTQVQGLIFTPEDKYSEKLSSQIEFENLKTVGNKKLAEIRKIANSINR